MLVKDFEKRIKLEIHKAVKDYGYTIDKIVLFGSRASESYKEWSDWDILVIIKENLAPIDKKKLWYRIFRSLHNTIPTASFDIILKTQKVYEREKEVVNTLSNEAEDGIIL